MKAGSIAVLRCPETGSSLTLRNPVTDRDDVVTGELVSAEGRAYPIVRGVPRFVGDEGYTGSFGMQWQKFATTQLDSRAGVSVSRDRFHAFTGWTPEQLRGKRVLDIGCGTGRFAEIALSCGAEVYALDYSLAVESAWNNLKSFPTATVIQGDVYKLPLAPAAFDYIYCLGVIQHTPDPAAAFAELPKHLKPGGGIAVDVYQKNIYDFIKPKYVIRPVTTRMSQQRLLRLIERMVPILLPFSRALAAIPVVGSRLKHIVPVSNYFGVVPLPPERQIEWSVLDTFDMLAPAHDHPQTAASVKSWFERAGLRLNIIGRQGVVYASGTLPRTASTQ